jgi:hypothetical protein
MVDFRNPPKYWNSYRPTYSPPPREQGRRSRQSHGARITPTYPRGQVPPSSRGAYGDEFRNPNLTLVAPRYRSSYANSDRNGEYDYEHRHHDSRDNYGNNKYDSPQFWDPSLDKLMGRTARAYDLVVAYERDSEGGKRWSHDAIVHIHKTGKHLHNYIRALKAWKRCAVSDLNHHLIDEDSRKTRELCEVLQDLIAETENKPSFEIALAATIPLSASGGYKVMGMGVKQDSEDSINKEVAKGFRHIKTDSSDPTTQDHHRARRQRRAQDADCYRPGQEGDSHRREREEGTVGRLGKHALHL